MRDLWKENKLLCILTSIAIIIIFLYYISYDWPEIIKGIGKWFELLCNIALALFANFIFFIFQAFLPNIKKRKKAFILVKAKIEWLYFLLSDIVMATEKYITLDENDNVKKLDGTKYFVRYDKGNKCGWLIRIEFTEEGINRYRMQMEKTLQAITDNQLYSYLSEELVEKISMLQSNEYMKYLSIAVNMEKSRNGKVKFNNSIEQFNIFKDIVFYLGKCIKKTCIEVQDAKPEQVMAFEREYKSYDEKKKDGIPRQWVEL